MAITAAQLNVLFQSQGASAVKGDLASVGGAVDKTGSGFGKLRAGALGLGTALIAPMGLGLKAAIDLEQGIANVNASLGGLDPGTLDALSAAFQEIGAASQYSATEVAAVGDTLAKAGFDADDLLGGMMESVVNLAQATGEGLTPAVDGIIQAMATWSPEIVGTELAMTDAARAADILTVAANESKAGIDDINAGMRSLGPVAAMMGIGYDEAAAAIALFTTNGLKGADAGVSLARGLQNLADPTSEASAMMDQLGIAAFDLEGNFVGFPSLFDQLKTGMEGLDQQTKLTALSTIFGAEAMDVMGLAILNGADPLEALIAMMQESGTAAEQSALRMDTLGAQFGTLTEGITTLLGSLVQGLIPGLRWLVDGANVVVDALMRIPAPIKTIIGAVAGGLAAIAAFTRAMQAFRALDTLTGGTGALRLPVAPVLGLAAAAGVLYLAWRSNFLGIRDVTSRVVESVTEGVETFVDRVRDTYRELTTGGRVLRTVRSRWGTMTQVWEDAGAAMSRPEAALRALAMGLRRIAGDRTPALLVRLAAGLDDVAGRVGTFIGAFQRLRSSGLTPVAAGLTALGQAFPSIAAAMTVAGLAVTRLWNNFERFRAAGLDPIQAGLTALAAAFPSLTRAVIPAIGVFDSLGDAIGDVLAGDVLAGFRELGQAAINLGRLAVVIGDWAISAAVDLATAVGSWVVANAGSILATIGDVAVSIGGWVISAVSDLWDAVTRWVMGGEAGDGTGGPMGPGGANQQISIGDVLINIGSWAKGIITDIAPYIAAWAAEAWDGVSSAAGTLWGVLVNIGSWAKGTISDIWPYIVQWTGELLSAAVDAAGTLWGVLINIGSWAKGVISDIWPYIVQWTSDLLSAAGEAAGTLWGVIVNIGSWAKGTISDIWPYIVQWTGELLTVAGQAAGTLWGVVVNIGSWAKGTISDLWPYVSQFAQDAWTLVSDNEAEIGPLKVKIGTFEVDIDVGAMWTAIDTKFREDTTVTPADLQGIEESGRGMGVSAGSALGRGIEWGVEQVFGGGAFGASPAGGAGSQSGTGGLAASVQAFVVELFEGIGEGMDQELSGPVQELSDRFAAKLQEMADGLGTAWENINWPSLSMPDIDWPDFPTEIPGWEDLKGAIQDIVDFLKDPWGGPISIPAPDISWPDLPDIPGDWVAWKESVQNFFDFGGGAADGGDVTTGSGSRGLGTGGLVVEGGGGGGRGERMPFRGGSPIPTGIGSKGRNTAGGGGQFAGLAQGIRDVKGAFDEASGSASGFAGELDTFAASAGTAASAAGVVGQAVVTGLSTALLRASTALMTAAMSWPPIISAAAGPMQSAGTAAGQGVVTGINTALLLAATGIMTATLSWPMIVTAAAGPMQAAGQVAGQGAATGLATSLLVASSNVMTEANTWPVIVAGVAGAMQGAGEVAGQGAATGVASGMLQGSANVMTEANTWPGIIDGIAGAMGAAGLNAGAAAGFGVANGIAAGQGAAVAAATALAEAVNAALSAVIQPGSPSKVTTRLGRTIPAGLVVGMEDGAGDVRRTSTALGHAAIPPITGARAASSGYVATDPGRTGGSGNVDNSITITFSGPITGGSRDELNTWASRELIPRIERAVDRQRRALGET